MGDFLCTLSLREQPACSLRRPPVRGRSRVGGGAGSAPAQVLAQVLMSGEEGRVNATRGFLLTCAGHRPGRCRGGLHTGCRRGRRKGGVHGPTRPPPVTGEGSQARSAPQTLPRLMKGAPAQRHTCRHGHLSSPQGLGGSDQLQARERDCGPRAGGDTLPTHFLLLRIYSSWTVRRLKDVIAP